VLAMLAEGLDSGLDRLQCAVALEWAHALLAERDAGAVPVPVPRRRDGGADTMSEPSKACAGFQWIGQSFAHCDGCGRPYWEHTHDRQIQKDAGPFDLGGWVLVPITPEQADACRRRWCPTCSGPCRETVGMVCQTCGTDYGTPAP